MSVAGDVRCSFCGKSQDEVRTIVVSGSSSICDECVVTALDSITRQPGWRAVRMGFIALRAVAWVGAIMRRLVGREGRRCTVA
jgi:ATP-dependent protease Clp ATPase subunit